MLRNDLDRGLEVRQTAYAHQLGLRGLCDAGPDDARRGAGVEDEAAGPVAQRAVFLSSLSIDPDPVPVPVVRAANGNGGEDPARMHAHAGDARAEREPGERAGDEPQEERGGRDEEHLEVDL